MRSIILTLIVMICLSISSATWNFTAQGWASRIAFECPIEDWLDTDICTIRPDGTQLRNLTRTPDVIETLPVWSPDRTKIAFKRFKGSPERWILLMDSAGRNVRAMEGVDREFPYDGYAWSPDGSKIVSAVAWYFSVYDVETGEKKNVWIPGASCIGNFAWSPNGRTFAFEWKPSNAAPEVTSNICVINVDGSSFRQLTRHLGEDRYPAWSPDGRQIAFSSHRNHRGGIFLMNADGSDVKRLTDGGEESPSWSPDGQRIAFHVKHRGSRFIGVMKKNGRAMKLIAEGQDPSWQSTFPWSLPVEPIAKLTTMWGRVKVSGDAK